YFAGQSLPAAAATTGGRAGKPKVAEAVGRYLAQRGIAAPASSAAAASARPGSVASRQATGSAAESVVDRFLSRRAAGNPRPSAEPTNPSSAASSPPPAPAVSLAPPAPDVQVVPFVAEDDVRRARFKDKKIYINAKTIVTPAARDLDDGTILVKTD
ncbi:MAG: hypothetical protein WD733_07170, partial [Bryobacterales bacterium]